jgi:hypothetical protein
MLDMRILQCIVAGSCVNTCSGLSKKRRPDLSQRYCMETIWAGDTEKILLFIGQINETP